MPCVWRARAPDLFVCRLDLQGIGFPHDRLSEGDIYRRRKWKGQRSDEEQSKNRIVAAFVTFEIVPVAA